MKAKIMGRTIEVPASRVRGVEPAPIPRPPLPEAAGWPKRDRKWEYAYTQFLELEKQAGTVRQWTYEPFSLWLPGRVRYTPDFLVWYTDGRIELIEVKGWSKNLRDGKTRYKIAAAMFPCFTWRMVARKGHGWEEL